MLTVTEGSNILGNKKNSKSVSLVETTYDIEKSKNI